ncbi:MAG: alpha/beta hydrolase [Verrucomicrobiota bacterium]
MRTLILPIVLATIGLQSYGEDSNCLASKKGQEDSEGNAEGPKTRFIESNGIQMRIAEMGKGPLVIFLHGFPTCWYSWIHQLPAMAEAGYHAVAPDRRGIGESDAPEGIEKYDVLEQARDVVGIIDALGEETAIVVGHDSGAILAWYCAALHPKRFSAVIMMSIPFSGRQDRPFVAGLRQQLGENFHYILYFQEPEKPEAELDSDPRGFLSGIIGFCSNVPKKDPEITDPRRSAGGVIPRLGAPERLPNWFAKEDLEYLVDAYKKSGFGGMLNGYRNLDRDWELTPQLAGHKLAQPTLFVGGENDHILVGFNGDIPTKERQIAEQLRRGTDDLRGVHVIPNCRHFVQMEKADESNRLILPFLNTVTKAQRSNGE